MNAQSETWLAICKLDDIPPQGSRRVLWGQTKIAVFRTGDNRVFALEDKCPHKNGPLSEGIVHDGCVTCPLHNWVISLETGRAQGPDEGQTRTFPTRIEAGMVMIALA